MAEGCVIKKSLIYNKNVKANQYFSKPIFGDTIDAALRFLTEEYYQGMLQPQLKNLTPKYPKRKKIGITKKPIKIACIYMI